MYEMCWADISRSQMSVYPHKWDAAAAAPKALCLLCCPYASTLVWKDHLYGKETKFSPKPFQTFVCQDH